VCDLEIFELKQEHSSSVILLFILETQQFVQVANSLLCEILHALSRDTIICCQQCRNEVGEKRIKELESLRNCTSLSRVGRHLIPTVAVTTHLAHSDG